MQIKFFLKDKNSEQTSIVAIIRNKGQRYKIYTVDKVKTLYWNPNTYRCRLQREYLEAGAINATLDEWEKLYNEALNYFNRELVIPDSKTFKAKVEELVREKKKELYGDDIEKEKKEVGLLSWYDDMIKTMATIGQKNIKSHKSTRNKLMEFSKGKEIPFAAIDMKWYNKFRAFLIRKNLSKNYIGKLINNVIVVMNDATENEVNTNLKFHSKKFKRESEPIYNIYNTVDELIQLYKFDFSKHERLEKVVDRYLLGCFTGMRYSDYKRIGAGNIEGNDYVLQDQQKVDGRVKIPLHWIVKRILAKYDGELPKPISEQKFRDYLKEAAKMAGIDSLVIKTITKGNEKITTTYKKYELMTTHTARRSLATNLYLAHVPLRIIQILLGHKTTTQTLRYIKATVSDEAESMKDNPFFQEPKEW